MSYQGCDLRVLQGLHTARFHYAPSSKRNLKRNYLMRFFADSTDKVWKAFGQDDPYFGVLSCDEYTRNNLSDSNLEKFFQSGETAIEKLLSSIEALGLKLHFGRVLDFGLRARGKVCRV